MVCDEQQFNIGSSEKSLNPFLASENVLNAFDFGLEWDYRRSRDGRPDAAFRRPLQELLQPKADGNAGLGVGEFFECDCVFHLKSSIDLIIRFLNSSLSVPKRVTVQDRMHTFGTSDDAKLHLLPRKVISDYLHGHLFRAKIYHERSSNPDP